MKRIYTNIFTVALCALGISAFAQKDSVSYTGNVQVLVVPPCVDSIKVDIVGAQGGGGNENGTIGNNGGLGGRVQAEIAVTPGDSLFIYVGGHGDSAVVPSAGGGGGYNGGGYGQSIWGSYAGGGGGGATDIRLNGTALTNRIFVAGGGGGGSYDCSFPNEAGGAGGGLTGGDGGHCGPIATGATQSAGGTGANYNPNYGIGQDGSLGYGGNAADTSAGAGGGGGYYGGGGGSWGGGGGGSGYADPSAVSVTQTTGYQAGDGYAVIKFVGPIDSVPVVSGPISACANSSVKFTCASVPGASTYTWSVPSGATLTGQGKDTITITFGSASGNVSVHTNLCAGDSSMTMITVNPLPSATLSATKDTNCVTITADSLIGIPMGGVFGGPGVTGSNFDPSSAGAGTHTLTYIYTDTNGCVDTATTQVVVNLCTGIREVNSLDNAIHFYPDPFTVQITVNVNTNDDASLTMFNAMGQEVGTWSLKNGNNIINTQSLPDGVYLMQVKTQGGMLNKKLIKTN